MHRQRAARTRDPDRAFPLVAQAYGAGHIVAMHPRPDPPAAGQESVWTYPRPAIAEPTPRRLRIVHRGAVVADSVRGVRTLETSHPPTYYVPREDVAAGLRPTGRRSLCEWKGQASLSAGLS